MTGFLDSISPPFPGLCQGTFCLELPLQVLDASLDLGQSLLEVTSSLTSDALWPMCFGGLVFSCAIYAGRFNTRRPIGPRVGHVDSPLVLQTAADTTAAGMDMIAANFGFATGLTRREGQVAADFSDMARHHGQSGCFGYC